MDSKIKFFDEVFKMLVSLAVCAWVIYGMLVIFVSDGDSCGAEVSGLFRVCALAAGILTAPPIVYGLIRLVFWPEGPKSRAVKVASVVLSCGAGLFVAIVILFAAAVARGCQ